MHTDEFLPIYYFFSIKIYEYEYVWLQRSSESQQ